MTNFENAPAEEVRERAMVDWTEDEYFVHCDEIFQDLMVKMEMENKANLFGFCKLPEVLSILILTLHDPVKLDIEDNVTCHMIAWCSYRTSAKIV